MLPQAKEATLGQLRNLEEGQEISPSEGTHPEDTWMLVSGPQTREAYVAVVLITTRGVVICCSSPRKTTERGRRESSGESTLDLLAYRWQVRQTLCSQLASLAPGLSSAQPHDKAPYGGSGVVCWVVLEKTHSLCLFPPTSHSFPPDCPARRAACPGPLVTLSPKQRPR